MLRYRGTLKMPNKSWLADPLDIFRVKDAIEALAAQRTMPSCILVIRGKEFRIKRDGFSAFYPSEPAYRIDPVEGFIPCGRFSIKELDNMLEGMG